MSSSPAPDRYRQGMATRRAVLGDRHVDAAEANKTAFDEPFPESMPWYFRTLGSWMDELAAAGLVVRGVREPLHPETGRPLSLLLHCAAA